MYWNATKAKAGGASPADTALIGGLPRPPKFIWKDEELGSERAFEFTLFDRQMNDCAECANADANPPNNRVIAI